MYKLEDCIRFGFLVGALTGVAVEAMIALQGGNATAIQLLLRSAYSIAHAAVMP